MDDKKIIKVAVNVFVIRDEKVLLGRRKNVVGDGMWALPGGHVEFGERLVSAAKRELLEETGLMVNDLKFLHIVNDPIVEEGIHYIHVDFIAGDFKGNPKLGEPGKCSEWKWFNFNNLPKNIFGVHGKLLSSFLEKVYFKD